MELTMQQIIDDLAERIGRPAILEDRSLRLIAYSAHDEPVDLVRETSILRRHATPEVRAMLTDLGIRQARRPVRVPGNPELHMLPRVCVPILYKDQLLGHLWFVDEDESMSVDEIALCRQRADQLALLLHRESLTSNLSSARLTEAVENLLSDTSRAPQAARSLHDSGEFAPLDGVVTVVVHGTSNDSDWPLDIKDPLTEALATHLRSARRLPALHLIRRDHCVLVVASPDDDNGRLAAWVASLRSTVQAALSDSPAVSRVVAGIGGHRDRLDAASQSFREARMAVEAAIAFPALGDVVHWSYLGVNQVVVRLAAMGEDAPVVHAGLRRLLASPEALPLVETLETYLDVAGNAQLTAERLNLHRTSLYYRLQRVEELAQTDLKNGLERLALHVGLKLARVTGEYVPRHPVDAHTVRRHSISRLGPAVVPPQRVASAGVR